MTLSPTLSILKFPLQNSISAWSSTTLVHSWYHILRAARSLSSPATHPKPSFRFVLPNTSYRISQFRLLDRAAGLQHRTAINSHSERLETRPECEEVAVSGTVNEANDTQFGIPKQSSPARHEICLWQLPLWRPQCSWNLALFCHLTLTLFLASHHLFTTSFTSTLPSLVTHYFTPSDVYLPGIYRSEWSNVSVEMVMVYNILNRSWFLEMISGTIVACLKTCLSISTS